MSVLPAPTITRDDLASPWRRLGAALIDGILLSIPIGIIFASTWHIDPATDRLVTSGRWSLVVVGLLTAVYQVVGVAVWGRTVGKLVTGIRVVSAKDLSRPGWVRALIRWGIFWVVGWIPFVGGLLSLVFLLPLLWTMKRQGVHDMAADTLVVANGV